MTVVTDGGGGAKQRALAVIGAIALIAAAFVARSMIAGGDDDGSGGGGSSSSGEAPVVACTPDLEPLCDALANAGAIAPGTPAVELGSPEATAGTFTRATAEDGGDEVVRLDGWIAWDPGPALANFDSGTPAAWSTGVEVLGTDQLAILSSDRTLPAGCEDGWECVAGSGKKLGVGRPATSEGIARLAAIAPAFAEGLDHSSLREQELHDVVENPSIGQSALAKQLSAIMQPGQLDVLVGPLSTVTARAQTPQGISRGLQVHVPDPQTTISVVLATSSRSERDLTELVDLTRSDALQPVRAGVGMAGAPGDIMGTDMTGFLYQVRDKVNR